MCAKLKYYGFNENAVIFFTSYLNNRHQIVRTKSGQSEANLVKSGVPQGSILGPLLFLIYTSDIYLHIEHCNMQTYADDTQLLYSFHPDNFNLAAKYINADLMSIYNYSVSHNLILNPSKSAVILFCSKNYYSHLTSNMTIKINNENIPHKKEVKNLGVVFDCRLGFDQHVNNLLKKSYLRLKLLYSSKHILNYDIKKKLCETTVLPIFYFYLTTY